MRPSLRLRCALLQPRSRPVLFRLRLLFFAGAAASAQKSSSPEAPAETDWTRVPAVDWERAKPEAMGYSSARREALRAWLKTQQTAAMMVVVHGKVIFEYGDLSLTSKVAWVRKSILAMLYGNYVFSGTINLDKTVKELGLNEKEPFLPWEEHATLEQLLTSRSGIYLPSGNDELDQGTRKTRQRVPGNTLRLQQLGLQRCRHGVRETDGKEYLRRVRVRSVATHRHAGLRARTARRKFPPGARFTRNMR
jgi:CubicO group peptidase (beta-lactamase class C family)